MTATAAIEPVGLCVRHGVEWAIMCAVGVAVILGGERDNLVNRRFRRRVG